MKTVPMLDLTRIEPDVQAEIEHRVTKVLRSGRYILGPEVEEFEARIAAYLGVKYAIGVSSGTDALIVSLMALGIGPGDEVVVPTYTFCATAEAVVRVGATPVFADCALGSFLTYTDARPGIKVVIPVSVFGEPCPLIGHGPGVLIEDAAQAIGAASARDAILRCFSFFPSKNLGAMGDGGLVTTNDAELAKTICSLRSHGRSIDHKYDHLAIGGNFRLDEVQAAVLNAKLSRLDEWTERRRKLAGMYLDVLGEQDGLVTPRDAPGHVWNQYVVRIPGAFGQSGQPASNARDRIQRHLAEHGIETAIYWPTPLHLQPAYKRFARGPLPNAELAAAEALALPISPWHAVEEIEYVCEKIGEALRRP